MLQVSQAKRSRIEENRIEENRIEDSLVIGITNNYLSNERLDNSPCQLSFGICALSSGQATKD